MNIKEAKQEIIHTVQAYLRRDETGMPEIPHVKQRPILLIGPPGIGKTAIMEQIANELQINLVSYTITHHTRQSAIGLPFIEKKDFDGQTYSVTEYTMSEIIASVYEQIERTGIREGILFLDEINCVSETLAPTMLQFLQYKTFGAHKVPEGFVIVTAGNPPQYNKSVRDFDIVTLDRLKRIYITEDYEVWREYAYTAGIHGAVMAYLAIRKEHFYSIRQELEEKSFVTARGWEDLSGILTVYEKMGVPVTEEVVRQYLQDYEIAKSFASYYQLYKKYSEVYRIPDILQGYIPEDRQPLKQAPFDEKLSLIGLLTDALNQGFGSCADELAVQSALFAQLKDLRAELKESGGFVSGILQERGQRLQADLLRQTAAGHSDRREERRQRMVIKRMDELIEAAGTPGVYADDEYVYRRVQTAFAVWEEERMRQVEETDAQLTNVFRFLAEVYGEGQEMLLFLSELTSSARCTQFIEEYGNEAFSRYNRLLLLKDRTARLQDQVRQMMKLQ